MTVKTSISLTDQQHAFANRLVEEGRFSSVSAVLQQGLDLLRSKTEIEEWDMEALWALLEKRRKGPFISGEEMDRRIDAMIERKRREYGV